MSSMIKIPPSSQETLVIQHEGKIYHAQPINSVVSSGKVIKLNDTHNNVNAKKVILMNNAERRSVDDKNINNIVVKNKVGNKAVIKLNNNLGNNVVKLNNNIGNNVVTKLNKNATIRSAVVSPNINRNSNMKSGNNPVANNKNIVDRNAINNVGSMKPTNNHVRRPANDSLQNHSSTENIPINSAKVENINNSKIYNKVISSPEIKNKLVDNSQTTSPVNSQNQSLSNSLLPNSSIVSDSSSVDNNIQRCMDKSGNVLADGQIKDFGKNNIIGACCDKIYINGDKNNIGERCYNIYSQGDYHQIDKNVMNCWIQGKNMHIKQNCGNSILEGSHGLSVNAGEYLYGVPMTKMGVTKVGKAQESKLMLIARVDKNSSAHLYNSLCIVCHSNYLIYLPHNNTISIVTIKFIARSMDTANAGVYATGTATNTVVIDTDGNSKWENNFFVINFESNKLEKSLMLRGVNIDTGNNSVSIEVVNANDCNLEVIANVKLMSLSG